MFLSLGGCDTLASLFASKARFEIFAPGRVNLIGEHTDYNGGRVLPFALDLGVTVRCGAGKTDAVGDLIAQSKVGPCMVFSSSFSADVLVLEISALIGLLARCRDEKPERDQLLLPDELRKSWTRYALGAVASFVESGADALEKVEAIGSNGVLWFDIESSLPVGSGLSSSAALCSALISSLSVLTGSHISAETIARLAMTVEHRFSGTKCGLMDQLAVMLSRVGHFTHISFLEMPLNGNVDVDQVRAHEIFSSYTAVALHTGVTHSLADSEYNQRRAACEKTLSLLNRASGRDCLSLGEYSVASNFLSLFKTAPDRCDQSTIRSFLAELFSGAFGLSDAERFAGFSAHAIAENFRVERAIRALRTGDLLDLDDAMRESHQSLRDDYRVSCKELDIACEIVRGLGSELGKNLAHGVIPVIGPRMTGGGFGGSTVQLVHNSILEPLVLRLRGKENPYTAATGKTPTVIISHPQNGLRIAIS